MYNKVVDIYCKDPNLLLSVFNEMDESGMNEEEALSRLYVFCPTKRAALYLRSVLPISWNNIFICPETRNSKNPSDSKEIEKYIKWIKTFDMKFDYIIQNPPYNGNLHLDFFEKGLNLLNKKGKMVIIEPSTWLINIRNSGGSANKFSHIKKLIEGHVESIKIENYNKEFGTSQYVPFAITTVDFSKTFETIDFYCCGEKKVVNSIYDCNLVGEYNLIWSILNKVKNFGDMMINHTTTKDMGDGMYYAKYYELVAMGGLGITSRANCGGIIVENAFKNDIFYYNGFGNAYFDGAYSVVTDEIRNTPLHKYKVGGKPGSHIESDKIADNVYGTKEEIENWRHFILKNKLPLFISIALTIHQQNVVTGWLPWLVDKQYTDEEINEMFRFTDEEIAFINRTLKKFERNSPWFKRYMCGPDSVSDEEVNNFIKSL